MARKKRSDGKTGADNEQKFVDLRISQGYLSFKRNRVPFGPYDMWKEFDVLSMNADGIELAQVKTAKRNDTRGAPKRILAWIEENRDKIPPNTTFMAVVWIEEIEQFYMKEIEWK